MKRARVLGISFLMVTISTAAYAVTDEEFLKMAIGINLAEIAAGDMAQRKGESEQVKSFGELLTKDHTKANEEASRIATEMQVTVPSEPSVEEQQAATQMESLAGTEFDSAFAAHMVAGHEKAIALFEDKADDEKSEVTAFAEKMLPDLKKHLETATSISEKQNSAVAPTTPETGAMRGAETGTRPLVGAETGTKPMESAEPETNHPMTGDTPQSPDSSVMAEPGDSESNQPGATPMDSSPASDTAALPTAPNGLKTVDAATISVATLIGTTVYGAGDETVGEVSDVLLAKDGEASTIEAVVVDVGGFLGIGEKSVAIAFGDLAIMTDDSDFYLYAKVDRQQLESATAYDAGAYQENPDNMVVRQGR
jgi:predicted outer membrane protein